MITEAIAAIWKAGHISDNKGAERCGRLLSLLDDPQDGLHIIHVAGSNGKGSCSAMLSSILTAVGYRTGLFTSPHIENFNERIKIDDREIPDERLSALTEKVLEASEKIPGGVSSFELMTAIAFIYFAEEKCEFVVSECGLGGRYDATNAVKTPVITAITGISMEHTAILGKSIEEIAWHKAGIIKTGVPCVFRVDDPQAAKVIEDECKEKGAPCHRVDTSDVRQIRADLSSQVFERNGEEFELSLTGDYQIQNSALVLECVDVLKSLGFEIPLDAVREGLVNVHWPCRMEVISREPLFIIDGGCDIDAAKAVAESIAHLAPEKTLTLIIGLLDDKDAAGIIKAFIPLAKRFLCVSPSDKRGMDAGSLADIVRSLGGNSDIYKDASEAVDTAISTASKNSLILAFGSLYLAGEIKQCTGW